MTYSIIKRKLLGLLRKIDGMLPYGLRRLFFKGSSDYWEERYKHGGNSGLGSYGKLAEFKAEIINKFVKDSKITSIIEFGSGDGNQLNYAEYPYYIGVDISPTSIAECIDKFKNDKNKKFIILDEYQGEKAELALSLDVIYHLVEDNVYIEYMERLFSSATKYVIVYSSNTDNNAYDQSVHVRHREFSKWVENNKSDWKLVEHIPNRYPHNADVGVSSFADFFIFSKG